MFKKLFIELLKNPLLPFRKTRWAIGIVNNFSTGDILNKQMTDIIWIEGKFSGDFFADPFVTKYFGEPLIFFENYDDKSRLGRISYIAVSDVEQHLDNIEKYIHTALELTTHLSYPYLFEYKGQLYMVPENYQSHTIPLYKAGSNPDIWEKTDVFIYDFDGIDTTIFEHNGKWWMFSTRREAGTDSEYSELYIWYSETPLGNWKVHELNPIRYDSPIARGAGSPFIVNGELYRPVQDCSQMYGGELLIKKITTLTPNDFKEEIVKKCFGYPPFEDGFHTYCSYDDISVIDGSRKKYSLINGWNNLSRMIYRKI